MHTILVYCVVIFICVGSILILESITTSGAVVKAAGYYPDLSVRVLDVKPLLRAELVIGFRGRDIKCASLPWQIK